MGERTEDATPKRMREAANRGQIARSHDFSSAITFIVGIWATFNVAASLFQTLIQIFNNYIAIMPEIVQLSLQDQSLQYWEYFAYIVGSLFYSSMLQTLQKILPVIAIISISGILASIAVSGLNVTTATLSPNFDKFNPINNIQQRFSIKAVIEMVKNLIKISVVAWVVWSFLKRDEVQLKIIFSFSIPYLETNMYMIDLMQTLLTRISLVLFVMGLVDLMYQKYEHSSGLKMTKSEVKQEYKESEGDPLIKSARKRFQDELLQSSPGESVKNSKAMITNPTHIVVGVAYDGVKIRVPTISIKGTAMLAKKLLALAEEHQIPIIEKPDLAWGLWDTPVEHPIPLEFFKTVAIIFQEIDKKKEIEQK